MERESIYINKEGKVQFRLPDGSPISARVVVDEILQRIAPDGAVYESQYAKKRKYALESDDVIDFQNLSPEQYESQQQSLAEWVYTYAIGTYRKAAFDKKKTGQKIKDQSFIAHRFARVRHNPDFVSDVKELVDEAIQNGLTPSEILQQRRRNR